MWSGAPATAWQLMIGSPLSRYAAGSSCPHLCRLQHPPDPLLLVSALLQQLLLLLVASIDPIHHLLLRSLPTQRGLGAPLQHRCPQRPLPAGVCRQLQHSCTQTGAHQRSHLSSC